VRRIALFALIQLVFLSACGGGSNSLAGSGGGGGGGGQIIASAGPNVVAMTVDAGPSGGTGGSFNTPFIMVTVCAPGSTTNCQTIDHIEVDTGSFGFRVMSSVLNSTLLAALQPETTAGFGVPIVECTKFGDGFSWGSIRQADVHISSEVAAGIPIQVIGDPNFPTIPTPCSNTGKPENTVGTFGANGILGVGPFVPDCLDCVNSTQSGDYYACPTGGGTCSATMVLANQIVSNPVASFATDNNGVIVEMPSVPDAGAPSVTGALVFGIGTQSNNALGSATVLTTDQTFGEITINYKNTAYANSFLDTGSNLNYFVDGTITLCPSTAVAAGFFCPSSELSLSAINEGLNNVQSTVSFNVGNADTLFTNTTFTAFNNMGAPSPVSTSFDFGMPFFYGRNVFTAIAGKNTSGGMGPYFAY
jgi:Protein of unknown function (DUF3443)